MGYDTKAGTSIAYINEVKRDEEFKEIRLMNLNMSRVTILLHKS